MAQNSPFLGKVHPRVQLCRHREVLRLSIQDERYEQYVGCQEDEIPTKVFEMEI